MSSICPLGGRTFRSDIKAGCLRGFWPLKNAVTSFEMLPKVLQIRNIALTPATVLAPMAGVTDTVFRRMIRGLGGCGLIMTEFTSAEGVTRNAARTLHYLYFQPDEHPISGQLFGADPNVRSEEHT